MERSQTISFAPRECTPSQQSASLGTEAEGKQCQTNITGKARPEATHQKSVTSAAILSNETIQESKA